MPAMARSHSRFRRDTPRRSASRAPAVPPSNAERRPAGKPARTGTRTPAGSSSATPRRRSSVSRRSMDLFRSVRTGRKRTEAMRRPLFLLFLTTFPALTAAAAAQPARLANARLEPRPVTGGLQMSFRALAAGQESPAWVAWMVPTPGIHHMCCYGSMGDLESGPCSGRCFLESEGRNVTFVNSDDGDCVERSGSSQMLVLLRLEARAPERLRTFSSDCTLDAGGLQVFWLSEVRPSESVALLQTFVGNSSLARKHWKTGEPALSAIALHDDPSADAALERFAAPGNSETLRKKAFFWLGNARHRRGYEVLRTLARKEEGEDMRRHLTFALSQSKVPEATETLMEMA